MKPERCTTPPRLAYLVRCWPVETANGPVWRATAEDPHSAERYSFADLDALFAFLRERTEACLAPHTDDVETQDLASLRRPSSVTQTEAHPTTPAPLSSPACRNPQ